MEFRFTFTAPTIFSALQSLGIDPILIDRAECGDTVALTQLREILNQWDVRDKNAKVVWSVVNEITDKVSSVAGTRAGSVQKISGNLLNTQKSINSVRETDEQTKSGFILNQAISNNRIASTQYRTGKQLNLATFQHKEALRQIDAKVSQVKKQSRNTTRREQWKAAPGSNVIGNAVRGVGNWFRNLGGKRDSR